MNDPVHSIPLGEDCLKRMNSLKMRPGLLLLAVTGGIASGKSTVANMLARLGAPMVDLDVIARIVVEPGKPAWKDIVSFFGEGILAEDGRLDRKKLSTIVFKDPAKRERLEHFTHPRVFDELARQVDSMVHEISPGVVQVVVPLLFEVNVQGLFHKVLLVYVPRQTQMERLMQRDGIPKQEASRILDAQMDIDEKLSLADYVIRNDGSLEETRKQVLDFWQNLQRLSRRNPGDSMGLSS
jgi:dephospho-CoA kinase